tara:strand:- start:156432 stop:157109 length:678 start_codon:yes stop_codon:yes gene_type:complete
MAIKQAIKILTIMKTLLTIFFYLLLFACNNAEEKKSAASGTEDTPTSSSAKTTEAASKDGKLSQNSTYKALFERDSKNCDFITAESMAKALGVSENSITEANGTCAYNFSDAYDNVINFRFTVTPWGNKQILKEIKSAMENAETFGKDSKLSQYRISETGDTYLSMHQNRMVRILNEKANNVITILYKVETRAEENSIEQVNSPKDSAREHSYTIANYLLNTHKK